MTDPTFVSPKPWIRRLAAALVCLGVAACQEPERATDYQKAFPLTVSKETVTLSLAAPGEAGFSGQQALDFESFVVDYRNRGRGPVRIEAGTGAAADRVRALLTGKGIPPHNVSIAGAGVGAARDSTVTLSFAGNKVDVPDCGEFTSKTTPNWTNRRHSNYGCATRRNLGLMVRDPADLERAQPESPPDDTRLYGVIGKHQVGAPIGGASAPAAAKKK